MKKLTINSEDLKSSLSKLAHVVSNKHPLPVLQNVLCKVADNHVYFTGTNTEITISISKECSSDENFEFLLPFNFANKIVALHRHAPLDIAAGKKVKITCGSDVYELKVPEKIEDFPAMPNVDQNISFSLYGIVLQSLNTALATVAGPKTNKAVLQNVLLSFTPGKTTVASSDGVYSVYCQEVASESDVTEDFLIGQNVIKVLDLEQEINVSFNKNFIAFEMENLSVINTRSQEKFVSFRDVFPADWPANLKVDKKELEAALHKCALTSDQLHAAKIDFTTKGSLKLSADDHLVKINLSIPGDYSGTVENLTLNSEKLINLLSQINDDNIELGIHNATKAIVITCQAQEGYKGLLMPIANV